MNGRGIFIKGSTAVSRFVAIESSRFCHETTFRFSKSRRRARAKLLIASVTLSMVTDNIKALLGRSSVLVSGAPIPMYSDPVRDTEKASCTADGIVKGASSYTTIYIARIIAKVLVWRSKPC